MSLNPILQTLDTGSTAFAATWRAWLSQYTQPQLLKLAEAYLGARLFHSSQMGGFATRKLREPGPRVFLAVGYLNLAHARSIGYDTSKIEEAPDLGLPTKLPDALRALWEGRQPLCDASGVALGPTGLFQAFTGLRALPAALDREIPPDAEQAASVAVGRFLRLRLAANGIDWLTEMPTLRERISTIEPLLMGRTVQGDQLVHQLTRLAAVSNCTDEELWQVIADAIAT